MVCRPASKQDRERKREKTVSENERRRAPGTCHANNQKLRGGVLHHPKPTTIVIVIQSASLAQHYHPNTSSTSSTPPTCAARSLSTPATAAAASSAISRGPHTATASPASACTDSSFARSAPLPPSTTARASACSTNLINRGRPGASVSPAGSALAPELGERASGAAAVGLVASCLAPGPDPARTSAALREPLRLGGAVVRSPGRRSGARFAFAEVEWRRARRACWWCGEGRLGHGRSGRSIKERWLLACRGARVEDADAQRGIHGLLEQSGERGRRGPRDAKVLIRKGGKST